MQGNKECHNQCPIISLLSFVSKKWVLLIIKSISDGCKSYSEIEKNLTGINPRILSNRLKELQDFGFIEKKVISEDTQKCIYCLNEKGQSFSTHIDDIVGWTHKWMEK